MLQVAHRGPPDEAQERHPGGVPETLRLRSDNVPLERLEARLPKRTPGLKRVPRLVHASSVVPGFATFLPQLLKSYVDAFMSVTKKGRQKGRRSTCSTCGRQARSERHRHV